MNRNALALMEATSFCAGVRHKRYSGQQEIAPTYSVYGFDGIRLRLDP
jgi:hypothetical protein